MAPQSLCDGDVSYKSDICSLGVIITEILTGRKEKFANGNVRIILPNSVSLG